MPRADLADDLLHDESWLRHCARSATAVMMENRGVTIGVAASAIIVFSVCVNALAWQDQPHPSAFFETRPAADSNGFAVPVSARTDSTDTAARQNDREVTRIVFDTRTAPDTAGSADRSPPPSIQAPVALPVPAPGRGIADEQDNNPVVEMQKMLASLGYYEGGIDGLKGPMTRAAIETYKANVGLRGIELSNEELLTSLRNNMTVTAAIPAPRPEALPSASNTVETNNVAATEPAAPLVRDTLTERMIPTAGGPTPDPLVMKVQAGLRAFGRTELEIDGLKGAATRAAVREFQSIFRLPVTGEIDPPFVEKMTAVGLID